MFRDLFEPGVGEAAGTSGTTDGGDRCAVYLTDGRVLGYDWVEWLENDVVTIVSVTKVNQYGHPESSRHWEVDVEPQRWQRHTIPLHAVTEVQTPYHSRAERDAERSGKLVEAEEWREWERTQEEERFNRNEATPSLVIVTPEPEPSWRDRHRTASALLVIAGTVIVVAAFAWLFASVGSS